LKVPYPRARPPAAQSPSVLARFIKVETIRQMVMAPQADAPIPQTAAPEQSDSPPPQPDVAVAPPAPELTPVATPSPAIAFAVPVEGPTQIVSAQQAIPRAQRPAPVKPKPPALIPQPAIRHITFGEGEGQQPPPEYPRDAVMQREEGTVIVRFTVADDGRVTSAYAITPSPWPLLNQAALRAIRETWRFNSGSVRTYEVPIEFQLAR